MEAENQDILEGTVGNFGKWQCKISVLMALVKFPIAWFQLGIVFLAPPTIFWCKQPDEYESLSLNDWLEFIKPPDNYSHHESLQHGSCYMKDLANGDDNHSVICQWGFDYNKSVVTSSIITDWNLVCNRARLVDLAQVILMLGVLVGNGICGVAADKYGRKKVLITCLIVQSIGGVLSALMPWFWLFLSFRFLLAIANGGTMITSFVMCMEIVGGVWRTVVPILYQIPFGIGNSLMAGLAYIFRDWRDFQLALSLLSGIYIFYACCIPESPRWLLAVGRKREMVDVLEKAATTNGLDVKKVKKRASEFTTTNKDDKEKPHFSALFKSKALKMRTIYMSLNWLICGITFYAFSQYLGQVSGNFYFTVAISGFIAFPGTIFCVFVVGRCGRRWTIASAHIFTALCFFAILPIPKGVFPQDWPRVILAALGIVGMSVYNTAHILKANKTQSNALHFQISMPALYLFTGELYPTVVRNAGVGSSVMFSRIGSMLAPLVIALQDLIPILPLLILGILAIIEAFLVLLLPETKGTVLAETLEDLENNNNQSPNDITNSKKKYVRVCTREPEKN